MSKSILIKDTSREEREQIVAEALGLDSYADCNIAGGTGIDYDLYVDGKVELRDLNAGYKPNIVMGGFSEEEKSSCVM